MITKAISIASFITCLSISSAHSAQTSSSSIDPTPLVIAVDGGYPPFSQRQPNGEVTGLDIDLARAICKLANLHCVLKAVPWDDMIPKLESGKIDAIVAAMSPTEQRKKRVAFTDTYIQAKIRFIGKRSVRKIEDMNVFASKRLGVEGTTSLDGYLNERFPKSSISRVRSVDALFALLTNGDVDYILTSALVGSHYFLKTAEGQPYAFAGPNINSDKWFGGGAAIAVNQKAGELKQRLNKAIAELYRSGKHEKIMASYLDSP